MARHFRPAKLASLRGTRLCPLEFICRGVPKTQFSRRVEDPPQGADVEHSAEGNNGAR